MLYTSTGSAAAQMTTIELHQPGCLQLLLQRWALAYPVQAVVRAVAAAATTAVLLDLHRLEEVATLQGLCRIPALHHQAIVGQLRVTSW